MKRLILIFILGLVLNTVWSQNTYEVVMSHSGVNDLYDDPVLDEATAELQTLLSTNGITGFKTLGADFYPILAYVDPKDGFSATFDNLKTTQDNINSSYSLVSKEHEPGGSINYRVHIKFPTTGVFGQLSPFEKEGIRSLFADAVNTSAKENGNSSIKSARAEAAGLQVLKDVFQQVIDGNLDIGLDLMAAAGFEGIDVAAGQYFQRPSQSPSGSPQSFGVNTVHDYTGLAVGNDPGSLQAYSGQVSVTLDGPIESMNALNHAYIITDENNTISELLDAEAAFNDADEKLIIWMHFNKVDAQGIIDKVNIKYADNITNFEAEQIVDELFEYRMSQWMPEIDFEEGTVAFREQEGEVRNRVNCSFSAKFGKCCLLPMVPTGSGLLNFGKGVGIGLLDGLLGTLAGIYEAGKKTAEVGSGAWQWIKSYTKEVVEHAIERRSVLSVFSKVGGDAKESLEEAWDNVVSVYDALKKLANTDFGPIVDSIWQAVKEWMGDLLEGDKDSGYTVGVITFELIVTAFTSVGAGAKFLPKIMGFLKNLTPNSAASTVRDLLASVTKKAKKGGDFAVKVFKCKVLGKGCFVKDTPVLMANNSIRRTVQTLAVAAAIPITVLPIQEVAVDDIVKSFEYSDHHYMTVSTEKDFDTASLNQWKSYDYLEITPETWRVGKFIVREDNGDLIEVEVNRPLDWFEKQDVKQVGDSTYFFMPEFGVFGTAILEKIRSTNIDTRKFSENQGETVERPVISTFRHFAKEVYDYKFSNGETIGCTSSHPFYSQDRQSYVKIGLLLPGEKVLTSSNREVRFIGGKLRDKGESVYNFEVWRSHSYFVGGDTSEDWLLVHNACWNTVDELKKMRKSDRDDFLDDIWERGIEWTPGNKSSVFGRGSFMESLLRDTKYKGKVSTGKNRKGKKDATHLGNDQYPTIDFVDGGNVISVKTTKKTNPYAWVASGSSDNKYIEKNIRKLLEGLRDGEIGDLVSGIKKADLDIYIKDFDPQYPRVEWTKAVNKYIDGLPGDLKAQRNKLSINVERINDSVND